MKRGAFAETFDGMEGGRRAAGVYTITAGHDSSTLSETTNSDFVSLRCSVSEGTGIMGKVLPRRVSDVRVCMYMQKIPCCEHQSYVHIYKLRDFNLVLCPF
jgi:hypothetical protein